MKPFENGAPYPLWDEPPLWQEGSEQLKPCLRPYLADQRRRGAVIVCAGGGYVFKSEFEAGPVAGFFASQGIHAFVLEYRLAPQYRHPCQLMDAQRAVRTLRHLAKEGAIPVLEDHIAILGFSAGGHLAALTGTEYAQPPLCPKDAIDRESARPDAVLPCYARLRLYEDRREGQGCRYALTGLPYQEETARALSPDLRVQPDSPPFFLWHTMTDQSVPVEDSISMALALHAKGIPCELHLFPQGRHGLGLAPDHEDLRQWSGLAASFLRSRGFQG